MFSTYTDKALLNSLFGKTSSFGALASAPTIYVGFSSTTPTPAGGNITEPSGNGYARVATAAADWNAAAYQDPAWAANTAEALNYLIVDSNGNQQKVTTGGTTGASAPSWNQTAGGTTTDGTVTWTNEGQDPAALVNNTAINSPSSTGAWLSGANLTYVVLFDAATGGNFLGAGLLSPAQAVTAANNTLSFPAGDLTIENT